MKKVDWALHHAEAGFWVFQIKPNGKRPKFIGWQDKATRDPEQICKMWAGKNVDCNIGAYTSKFNDKEALIVIDVDNKGIKDGDGSMGILEDDGFIFPKTFENGTPTGGRHVTYSCEQPVKQGADVLGDGLDIRSRGGYIVMAGSTIDGKPYTTNYNDVAASPRWLYSKLLLSTNTASKVQADSSRIDHDRAIERAEKLLELAVSPEEGARNDEGFKMACEFRDAGLGEDDCLEFMVRWNADIDDPLEDEEVETIVSSCYKTAQNQIGAKASEAIFKPIVKKADAKENPVVEMNKQYAFVLSGGGHHILWETTDERNNFKLEHINEPSFHKMLAHKTFATGDGRFKPLSKVWIDDSRARRYDGLVFAPEREVPSRFYNMWRGYAFDPLEDGATIDPAWQQGLDQFLEHALKNVCNGDEKLFRYLISYFAHMIQRPYEKPLVACVFKGLKGVGKNALVERVCALIAPHYIVADDRRYLTSNFNGHLESCLALILDEAAWPGDKEGEGKLKGLITGTHHNIEHKGKEPFKVDNLTRVFVLGNENWLVPATEDERRYAVFNVGNGRKQDRQFFKSMRTRMEKGGYRLLLTYLLNFDINVDINHAPMTIGLVDQKHASLEPFEQWWLDCITEGQMVGSLGKGIDFDEIHAETFRNAFSENMRRRQIRTRLPDERAIGKVLAKVAPSIRKVRRRVGSSQEYFYVSGGLEILRKDWEKYIGSKLIWPIVDEGNELECLT